MNNDTIVSCHKKIDLILRVKRVQWDQEHLWDLNQTPLCS